MTVVLLTLGIAGLVGGAELLVRGASRLARVLGLSPLLVGLTVVSFGTSAPELAVSLMGALTGRGDLAVGNVVGSNACNVFLILGTSAVITPLLVHAKLVRFDVPVMIAASLLLAGLAADGHLGRADGALLLAGLVAYVGVLARAARRETGDPGTVRAAAGARTIGANVARVLVGLGLLVLGSRWLVDAATSLARALGVSELVIGLTVVAVGTSLPELATSVLAALRGERDMAVGNVVGSNVFNILLVLGAAGFVAPGGVAVSPAVRRFDLPIMIAAAVACLPIFFTGSRIARWEGATLVGFFCAYTTYLLLRATQHEALPVFSGAMLAFVLPLTAITLVIITWREIQSRRRGDATRH